MRRFLTYPHVVSTLALVVAMSGTAYAAATITGRDVVDGSLSGRDVRNGSVRSADVAKLKTKDFARGAFPGARMEASGTLVIPPTADNNFEMDTEAYDTGNLYDAPNDFIEIRRPGTYLVVGSINPDESADLARQVRVVVDGDPVQLSAYEGNSPGLTMTVVTTLRLDTGQRVTLGTWNGSFDPIPVTDYTGENDAWLSVQWVGG
jgi:hypothetical protein